ncbi:hypothetical protein TSUD_389300 [Trifolium subterraneum]|uniref:non-specific serine/threonine protein kinase n=1 Tax=Trifolium subterraneum TaxID=3900 RepID=A0A2Z6NHA8_TRISU|nr:hypothetical protein TSUD_389300 [Trifolium subterraneum]
MANRDQPVNGKRSKLTLLNTGNIVLLDVSLNNVWSSNTASLEPLDLHLKNDGNLVLRELQGTKNLWQSFDSPTDTLVPGQPLTRYTKLVASRSEINHSSGFYQFFFNDENILGLHYNGRDVSSSYWPKPWLLSWDVGRSNFNSSRIAVLDSFGEFYSSDNFTFTTSDYGSVMQRIIKLDSDGVVRVYSRINSSMNWYVSWLAFSGTCTAHGVCGANSTCSYSPKLGRKCSCIPGYRMKNPNDWSYGCEPMFDFTCNKILVLIYAYKIVIVKHFNSHIGKDMASIDVLQKHNCKMEGNTFSLKQTSNPSNNVCSEKLQRVYVKEGENHFVKFFLRFATAIGAFQTVSIFIIWCSLFRTKQKTYADQQGYHLADIGFRKFSYLELKKATKGFSQEIGRGGGGVVYKGLLSDERHAAIKRLYNAQQGEGEFLAEVGIIGRLNHMNLIEMWGYCAEGKYRLLISDGRLVTWVREKRRSSISWLEEIVDPNIGVNYDKSKIEILAKVALDCVVDERDSRPTMSRVVEMLQYNGND